MALAPQKFREIVLQLLYSQEIGQPEAHLMTDLMREELEVSKKNILLAQERVRTILARLPEIDRLITTVSTSYDFERIQIVTKNILRLGVFELLFDDQIPPKVAIAEAIRLSRKFNTRESAAFVNALLDHLYRIRLGEAADSDALVKKSQLLMESEKSASEKALEELQDSSHDHI